MSTEFKFIIGANLELNCSAVVYAGLPAKIDGPPEDCYPAENPEVIALWVTVNGDHFELGGLSVDGRDLEDLISDRAIEVAAQDAIDAAEEDH